MIIACPSCATRYDLPPGAGTEDGTVIRCAACNHSWLEARAVEIEAVAHEPLALADGTGDLEHEARRIAEDSAAARRRFEERRGVRRRRRAGWAMLILAATLPVAVVAAVPDRLVAVAPAMANLYGAVGIQVNPRGFDIRNVENQKLVKDGTTVLAIRGDIVNISRFERKVPSLRFVLRDAGGRELYAWTLASVGARPLKAGEMTNFVTRVAAPPEEADNIEIRFARDDELGSNARP
jgi:predicted Zn finger-like uncharacterized protein